LRSNPWMARSKKSAPSERPKKPKSAKRKGSASVQDNGREILLASIFDLRRKVDANGEPQRQGIDADDHRGNPHELKSSTTDQCGSARDFSRETIRKWSRQYLIIGFGSNKESGYEFEHIYVLHPDDLKEWFRRRLVKLDEKDDKFLRYVESMERGGSSFEDISDCIDCLCKGALENNPKISLAYCRQYGTRIDPDPRCLEAFVSARPLVSRDDGEVRARTLTGNDLLPIIGLLKGRGAVATQDGA